MLDGMTHRQFAEWIAKDMIEPIGVLRMATIENQGETQRELESVREDGIPGMMSLESVGWRRG